MQIAPFMSKKNWSLNEDGLKIKKIDEKDRAIKYEWKSRRGWRLRADASFPDMWQG